MVRMRKLSFIAALLLLTSLSVPRAAAGEPPADLCALLPAADVSQILGQNYGAPDKSVAPRPYANTNTGTDCRYHSKSGGELWFRAYVDPSPAAATELFAKLGMWYSPQTPVKNIGDEAYFDPQHAIHVRKGKVRYYINFSGAKNFSAAIQKQIENLAGKVAGQL